MHDKIVKPTIILWDVHEVLFTRNIFHWAYLFITYPKKWRVIRSLDMHIIKLCARYLLHILHIKRAELSSEELISYAIQKQKYELAEIAIRIGCDYAPVPGIIPLVQKMHARGYVLHVASNLGNAVYENFKTLYPELFRYFDVVHIAYWDGPRIIKKPNPTFFKAYLDKNNLDPSTILFIDDKQYNIDAAATLGIQGIHFKNVKQLITELKNHNIFV
jgi:HAD superfamily hydrolase (TIGR01509 family)